MDPHSNARAGDNQILFPLGPRAEGSMSPITFEIILRSS